MKERAVDMLVSLVSKIGVLRSAELLKHENTSRISRWLKDEKVPPRLEEAVKIQLEAILKDIEGDR